METFTLVLVLWANHGASAIGHVPGIPTRAECEALAKDFENFGTNGFGANENIRARCVRSREVVQPPLQVERPK